jgi:hypothetical protein
LFKTLFEKLNTPQFDLGRLLEIYFIIVLIAIAGFRQIGIDRDSPGYYHYIVSMSQVPASTMFWTEPTQFIIAKMALLFGDYRLFFLLYAILGVTINILAIRRLANHRFVSYYLFICIYYALHEMTQIRAGVACGIFLMAVPDIVHRKPGKFYFKIFIAILFHYSAVIAVPLYFINPAKMVKIFWACLPIIALILGNLIGLGGFNLFKNTIPKIGYYVSSLKDVMVHIFNLIYVSYFILYYAFLFFISPNEDARSIVILKIFGMSLVYYLLFSSLTVASFRSAEFLGIVLVVLLPSFIAYFKENYIAFFILLLYALGIFCYQIFVFHLLRL